MRELAGELRDEGDEGVGRRAREKKKIDEERREKRSQRERERERERKGNDYLMRKGERSVIIFFFYPFELQCTSKDNMHGN